MLVVGALFVGSSPSGVGASNGFRPAGFVLHPPGIAPRASNTRAGKTLVPTFTCGAITCAAYEAGVNGFVQDVAHDSGGTNNVYSVATEYSDTTGSIAYNETFGGSYVDTSDFPANGCTAAATCLSEDQLVTEMTSDLSAKGWTASGTKLFIILLPESVDTCVGGSSACAGNVFCAYHDSSSSLIFAVEPFNASFGCSNTSDPTNPQGLPNGAEIDETVNTTSHEMNEAITDPYGGGWWSSQGNENGDLCAWWFGAPAGTTGGQPYNQVINGHHYSLQQEFSNSADAGAGGCLQHPGGTVSTSSPYLGPADSGPLVYHGGSVMRSATVYTIYWIPSATPPAISIAPAVTGTDAVGQQLSTTDGTWTHSPTSYEYKWQRCDTGGANCVDIDGATSSQYTLVTDDAGHEIRSEVLAGNGLGSATNGYAPSAPTSVIVGKPAMTAAPKLSGTAKVGRSLSVGKGRWTYSPTHYAYQWLRCSATGKSCKTISGATKSSYALKSVNVGHKLEAEVTASNAAGSATATSVKSAAVKK